VTTPSEPLPADLAAAHAMILAQREQLTLAKSEVTVGRLEIERLKLMLAKARREQFGQSSERGKLLVEQLELAIEDLEETQAEQDTRAEIAAPEAAKERLARNPRPPRRPLPDNLPVERIVEPAPCACGKCGSARLHKLGEVVSKTLECEPRRWKIIEHVREKFSCRDCEAITEAPAPSHPIPRGFAGPSLLAMVLVNKFLLHQPLNRQSKTFAREGIEIDISTLADRVKLTPHGSQYRGGCPACQTGGDRALVVTPAKGLFYCFAKKSGGDLIALTAHIRGIPVKDAADELNRAFGTVQNSTGTVSKSHATVPPAPGTTKRQPAFDPEAYAARLDASHASLAPLGLSPETLKAWKYTVYYSRSAKA
jgi:transposase